MSWKWNAIGMNTIYFRRWYYYRDCYWLVLLWPIS